MVIPARQLQVGQDDFTLGQLVDAFFEGTLAGKCIVVQGLWGERKCQIFSEAFVYSYTNLFHTQDFDPEAGHFFLHS